MTNKKKQLEATAFSVVGVVIMFVILVGIYIITSVAAPRIDLTKEKLFTLSDGTRKILAKLDTPVQIRFYCTQGKDMPVEFKTYAQRVEDLLLEYKKAAKGKIEIKKFDPQPDSDAEDSANLDGVQGQQINFGDKIYLGLAISMLDSKETIPLALERERLLEYDLSRKIARVATPQKPVIGVMSSLPVFGAFNPMMMRMGQGRQQPWIIISELKGDFDVKEVQMDVDKIDDEIKVLVLIHPKGISDKAQYALDQFVLRGGKLVAFLDPHSYVDAMNAPQSNPLQAAAAAGSSSLDKLLKAWGIEFDQNKVVADKTYVTQIGGRNGQPQKTPTVLSLTSDALDKDDVVTSEVGSLLMPYAGVFSGTPAEGLKQTVLLKTSKNSHLVEKFMAEFAPDQDYVPSQKEYPLAIRLTGKFKSAFPDGKPKDSPAEKEGEKKDEAKKEEPPAPPGLKTSQSEGVVILVGDADLLFDGVCARVQEVFGQRLIMPFNGNLTFAQNLVEQLAGDSNLISVRSRATMNRPFTLVKKMQAEAEERFRNKIKDLEKSLSDTQARLNELQQSKKGAQQRFILSPEQQAEVQKFQQKQAEVKKELKKERRNLRKDIDSLENRLKWVNIAGMPLVVTVAGISLAMVKRKRTAAT